MSNEWCWLAENETVVWEGRPRLTTFSAVLGWALVSPFWVAGLR